MTIALARKFKVDVTADTTLASGWVPLHAITDFDPETTPNLEDSSDYDTDGWSSSEPTMQGWTAAATFNRQMTNGVYDPGQELVRARIGKFGDAARIGIRWYDRNGGPEASAGVAIPTWKRSNTGVKNLEAAQVTFTGTDVPLVDITNPVTSTTSPVIGSISPAGAGTGAPVAISGTGFTGATAVTFGDTAATTVDVINDSLILAVLPDGAAGSVSVVVTTPAGTSAGASYTRAA